MKELSIDHSLAITRLAGELVKDRLIAIDAKLKHDEGGGRDDLITLLMALGYAIAVIATRYFLARTHAKKWSAQMGDYIESCVETLNEDMTNRTTQKERKRNGQGSNGKKSAWDRADEPVN